MLDVAFLQSRGPRSIETYPVDPNAFLRTWRGGRLRWEECQQLLSVFAPFSLAEVH